MYRVWAVLVSGDFRIHGDGCRDIKRGERKADIPAWPLDVTSRHEVNTDCWGDVSSDSFEQGTKEWHAACDENAALASVFLPCVPESMQ